MPQLRKITQDMFEEMMEDHLLWQSHQEGAQKFVIDSADFTDLDMSNAALTCAIFTNCRFDGARMSNTSIQAGVLEGCYFRGTDMSCMTLTYANMRYSYFSHVNFLHSRLTEADMRDTQITACKLRDTLFIGTKMEGCVIRDSDLSSANLSGSRGLLDPAQYMRKHFQKTDGGYIAYKVFGVSHEPPAYWHIMPGAILEEEVNPDRTALYGCGVNLGTAEFVCQRLAVSSVWECLISWEDLPSVIVPYATDGWIRCRRVRLIREWNVKELADKLNIALSL